MTLILVLRVAILSCIFLGVLFEIIATAGKEWEKYQIDGIDVKVIFGLWDYCGQNRVTSTCLPVNDALKELEKANLIESSTKGKDFFKKILFKL